MPENHGTTTTLSQEAGAISHSDVVAVLEDLVDSGLTASARLVAVIRALGIETPSEIERLTGLSDGMVRRAKRQLKERRNQSTGTIVPAEPEYRNQSTDSGTIVPESPRVRARIESPSGIHTHLDISPQTPQGRQMDQLNPDPYFENAGIIRADDGSLVLVNGTKARWLKAFSGDENRLELALIQAAGEVQLRSRNPLKLQVERTLARIAGQKHDGDNRYKAACNRNSTTPSGSAAEGLAVLDRMFGSAS